MVSVAVNTQSGRSRGQRTRQNLSRRLSILLLFWFSLFLVDGTKLYNLLDTSSTMKIQTGVNQTGTNALDKQAKLGISSASCRLSLSAASIALQESLEIGT